MKHTLLVIALATGFIFMAASVFANPALLKKRHEGYPNPDGGTTASGEVAAEHSAAALAFRCPSRPLRLRPRAWRISRASMSSCGTYRCSQLHRHVR